MIIVWIRTGIAGSGLVGTAIGVFLGRRRRRKAAYPSSATASGQKPAPLSPVVPVRDGAAAKAEEERERAGVVLPRAG